MTLPDGFEVLGSRRERQLQLGNAVPPLLARKVASGLLETLRDVGEAEPATLAQAA